MKEVFSLSLSERSFVEHFWMLVYEQSKILDKTDFTIHVRLKIWLRIFNKLISYRRYLMIYHYQIYNGNGYSNVNYNGTNLCQWRKNKMTKNIIMDNPLCAYIIPCILNCLLWPILLLCNRQFRVGYVISVLYINVNRQMNSINIIGVARNFVWGGPNRAACKLYEHYIYIYIYSPIYI